MWWKHAHSSKIYNNWALSEHNPCIIHEVKIINISTVMRMTACILCFSYSPAVSRRGWRFLQREGKVLHSLTLCVCVRRGIKSSLGWVGVCVRQHTANQDTCLVNSSLFQSWATSLSGLKGSSKDTNHMFPRYPRSECFAPKRLDVSQNIQESPEFINSA